MGRKPMPMTPTPMTIPYNPPNIVIKHTMSFRELDNYVDASLLKVLQEKGMHVELKELHTSNGFCKRSIISTYGSFTWTDSGTYRTFTWSGPINPPFPLPISEGMSTINEKREAQKKSKQKEPLSYEEPVRAINLNHED